jgi:hypothetical protein
VSPVAGPVRLTSKALLDHAHAVLDSPAGVLKGRWPRAVALLARQALETSLTELWQKRDVRMGWATERAQLLCVHPVLGDAAVAAGATLAWNALSRACHAHPYDLPPTAVELGAWLEAVEGLCRAVDAIPARPAGARARR